jgi:hypothetical protein
MYENSQVTKDRPHSEEWKRGTASGIMKEVME